MFPECSLNGAEFSLNEAECSLNEARCSPNVVSLSNYCSVNPSLIASNSLISSYAIVSYLLSVNVEHRTTCCTPSDCGCCPLQAVKPMQQWSTQRYILKTWQPNGPGYSIFSRPGSLLVPGIVDSQDLAAYWLFHKTTETVAQNLN
jgi:hypothetical protein